VPLVEGGASQGGVGHARQRIESLPSSPRT
jgi:hypothetical protein